MRALGFLKNGGMPPAAAPFYYTRRPSVASILHPGEFGKIARAAATTDRRANFDARLHLALRVRADVAPFRELIAISLSRRTQMATLKE